MTSYVYAGIMYFVSGFLNLFSDIGFGLLLEGMEQVWLFFFAGATGLIFAAILALMVYFILEKFW